MCDKKLDITSIKSLKDHGIEVTADGFKLMNADARIKKTGDYIIGEILRIKEKWSKKDMCRFNFGQQFKELDK
jgi:hypothetical protein